jgi:SAM-dependent methyltransferase
MQKPGNELLNEIAGYYSEKLSVHGSSPRGVDWNGQESQLLRFSQLCKVINACDKPFSLNDLGCGYGALLDVLREAHPETAYCGIDISEDMVSAARSRYASDRKSRFIAASEPDEVADYGLASGIFNVRLERTDEEWFEYIRETLDVLDRTSSAGFAFNCLTSYSDEEKKRDYLYYADPCMLFDLCKRNYSRQVALLHDYGLYEFTILVRKA